MKSSPQGRRPNRRPGRPDQPAVPRSLVVEPRQTLSPWRRWGWPACSTISPTSMPSCRPRSEVTMPERTMVAAAPLAGGAQPACRAGSKRATLRLPAPLFFLRPMARFPPALRHRRRNPVPRQFSMYLLAQYLIAKQGGSADYEMNELVDRYRELQTVNNAMADRPKAVYGKTGAQTLINLDLFSHNPALRHPFRTQPPSQAVPIPDSGVTWEYAGRYSYPFSGAR